MLNEATRRNLLRKSAYVDAVQLKDGIPMPSWIDLSLTELCNRSAGHARACSFCPRINPKFYPNQNLHMSIQLATKIAADLATIDFKGVVVLCGYGEPLLHPEVVDIARILKKLVGCRVEVVTNGDFLGKDKLQELMPWVDHFVVSLYDGPHQVDKFVQLFEQVLQDSTRYTLRDRWHSAEDQFGLKLTNRGGTVAVGKQDPVPSVLELTPCYYTAYQMQVDWNGDVLLCPQDWHKHLRFGNLNTQSVWEVWTDKRLRKRRMSLIAGRREEHPCRDCNTDGTLHGGNHASGWLK